MLTYAPCDVLLIDGDPAVLKTVQTLLSDSKPVADVQAALFHLVHVDRLSLGLDRLAQADHQVVLLELNLPDSEGLATLEQVRQAYPAIPTIVLTDVENDVIAVQAIGAGAQGFLSKQTLDANLLAYAVLLAADRQRQLNAVAQEAGTDQSLTEIENLERLAYSVRPSTVTANLFEAGLLKETVPEIFRQLVETYSLILDQVLEQRTFRVEYPISNSLRALAAQLGLLKAGARDVVELHTLALKQKSATENALKAKAYAEEGRLIALELMGYLATYYRKYFIGLSKVNTTWLGREES